MIRHLDNFIMQIIRPDATIYLRTYIHTVRTVAVTVLQCRLCSPFFVYVRTDRSLSILKLNHTSWSHETMVKLHWLGSDFGQYNLNLPIHQLPCQPNHII